MSEDKQEVLLDDIKKDAFQHGHGFITYKLIIHQGKIVGYEEIERRKIRRI